MTVRALAFATSNDEGLRLCNLLSLILNNSFKPNFRVSLPNHRRGSTNCLVTKPFLTRLVLVVIDKSLMYHPFFSVLVIFLTLLKKCQDKNKIKNSTS